MNSVSFSWMIEKSNLTKQVSSLNSENKYYDNSEKLKFVFTSFLMRKMFTSFEVSSFLACLFSIDNMVMEVAQPFFERTWCFVDDF